MPVDNKNEAPLEYYRARFIASDPYELSKRSGVPYENGAFTLRLLSREVKLMYPAMKALYSDGTCALTAITILLGRLVLEGTLSENAGRFMAYSEMPWGGVYNAQFTARCIKRIAKMYGSSPDELCTACERLGGVRISGADAAFELEFLRGLYIRLYLWEGDDEFPASAQILFSQSFAAAFTAEDIAVVGDVLINSLKNL